MRKNIFSAARFILLFVLSVLLLTGVLYYLVTSRYSFGADFFIYWNGARAVFLEHLSPYLPQVAARIQTAVYGHPAYPDQDQLRYAYPPFSLLVVFPAVFGTFAWAQAYWMALNFILLFSAVRFAWPHLPRWVLLTLVFFFPVTRGLILGQFALILGISLIGVYGLIGRQRPATFPAQLAAGALLAWALMKPQLTTVFIVFFLLQAFRRRLWGVFYGFLGGLAAFALLSCWWVPNWIAEWRALITAYVGYVPIQPLFSVYAHWLANPPWADWLGGLLLGLAGLVALWLAWRWWRNPNADFLLFVALAVVVQIISPNPNSMISDQIIFLLPILIWLADEPAHFRAEKPLWWGLFVLSVWAAFIIFFTGREPLAAEATLPLVGAGWLAWLLLMKRFGPKDGIA